MNKFMKDFIIQNNYEYIKKKCDDLKLNLGNLPLENCEYFTFIHKKEEIFGVSLIYNENLYMIEFFEEDHFKKGIILNKLSSIMKVFINGNFYIMDGFHENFEQLNEIKDIFLENIKNDEKFKIRLLLEDSNSSVYRFLKKYNK